MGVNLLSQFVAEDGLACLVLIPARLPLVLLLAVLLTGVSLFAMFVFSGVARAESAAPGWEVTSVTLPTDLAPSGGEGTIEDSVYNIGKEFSSGSIVVTDVLPSGVVAIKAADVQSNAGSGFGEEGLLECSVGQVVVCVNTGALKSVPIPQPTGPFVNSLRGGGSILRVGVVVQVQSDVPGTLTNRATVAGGSALTTASTSSPITVSPVPPRFGFQGADGWFSNADGTVDTQAGSHPYEFVFSFDLNTTRVNGELHPAGGQSRNLTVNLPPGFIGNPTAVPQCTRQQLEEESCPPSSQVGTDLAEAKLGEYTPFRASFSVYNMVPPPGLPAQFALQLFGVSVFLDASVRSGGDYGITVHTNNITQEEIMGNRVTFWGEPSDPSHDEDRYSAIREKEIESCRVGCPSGGPHVPFLTLPTACEGPQVYSASLDAWETEGFGTTSFLSHDSNDTPTGFTGCGRLGFGPTISLSPDTSNTDTPAGATVEVKTPQEGLVTPGALSTSNIKATTVTLPPGFVINPGQATGLQACQEGVGGDDLPLAGENGEEERFAGPADCPKASKVGTVQATTPLLKETLEGNVYVLQSNPPNLKLLAAFSVDGVNIKLVLNVHLNEQTGQITTTVANIPELPVSSFKLSFSGGAQAALATPTLCGASSTGSDFTPWSTPAVPDVFPSSNFQISAGTGGSGCPSSPLPFTPTLTAGSTTDQAGGFTNFSLLLQRPDDQQRISGLQFKAPPGLSAELSRVPICSNEQAETDTCPEASKIGHTVVESGPGPYPLVVPEAGQEPAAIYLTGPYNGTGACHIGEQGCAPFGLSIVVPLHVGPFVLPTQRVRAQIEVDPRTAQLTVTTNPLPQEVAGVPTDLREVDAVIEHPEFMFNPTNCEPSSFSGTAQGTPPPGVNQPSTSAPISSHFQVGSCRSLAFKPAFAAETSGKTSKAKGASLSATLSYPATPLATGLATNQANIHSVKVELPKQLPSRLTTLQKACTAAQFNTNPAGCPEASVVGQALVHTPVLPVPLAGPAYFVSHGGEAFPALVVVLQGYGVKIVIEATTFISKAGVTSLTFKTAPDAPFTSFTLTSPEGKYSALAANGNLCTSKLTMPTELVAQNGTVIHQTTKVNVTGCPKTKTLTRAQKLATALKTCHKDKNKTKRNTCEHNAHKKYGPTKTKKTTKKKK
jgi:hypothetical protein